jgi:hypothetical protein
MKSSLKTLGFALLLAIFLAAASQDVNAGRREGPMTASSTIPAGTSVFYNVTFNAGEQASVSIAGQGRSPMDVLIYDSEGHVAFGVGVVNRKTATMNVYKTGVFRIEVRNLNSLEATSFTLQTN